MVVESFEVNGEAILASPSRTTCAISSSSNSCNICANSGGFSGALASRATPVEHEMTSSYNKVNYEMTDKQTLLFIFEPMAQ